MDRINLEQRKWMYGCVLVLIIGCLHYFEFHQKFFTPPVGTAVSPLLEAVDTGAATTVYSETQIQKP